MTDSNNNRPGFRPAVLTSKEAAIYLGFKSTRTLENWRHGGTGPKFVQFADRTIRYTLKDLDNFILERTQEPTK